jgi:hypothetical protein
MLCIEVRKPDLLSYPVQLIERGSAFLESYRGNCDREELTITPYRNRPAIPVLTPDFNGVKVVLHEKQVPAGAAGIEDLIRRI